ncbi:MAG: hypothetical protein NTY66_00525 [Candidatus Vogelbacteria bacterium]|nr:hypothetical protein [Candidatus Vogelbacteria bacterium]
MSTENPTTGQEDVRTMADSYERSLVRGKEVHDELLEMEARISKLLAEKAELLSNRAVLEKKLGATSEGTGLLREVDSRDPFPEAELGQRIPFAPPEFTHITWKTPLIGRREW